MLAGLLIAGSAAALVPAAHARTDTRNRVVYFVHGWSRGSNADCAMWNTMRRRFREWGGRGAQRTVGYYVRDRGCNTRISSSGSHSEHFGVSPADAHRGAEHTNNARIEHLAYHLAWHIYDHYSSKNKPVDVVAHSMGGLVIRYALAQVQAGHRDFPRKLLVEDVVTLGTPHGGARGVLPTGSTEVAQMAPGSELLKALELIGWEPDGSGDTDWLTMGSDDDAVVAADRAAATDRDRNPVSRYMGSSHKVWYTTRDNIEHNDYYRDDSTATTAQAYQSFDGAPFMAWPRTLWPVRRTFVSLVYGDM
jgi:pimeloyl-ACP methyl ester carboxylesterase